MKGTYSSHLRSAKKTSTYFACIICTNRQILQTVPELYKHVEEIHGDQMPQDNDGRAAFLKAYRNGSAACRTNAADVQVVESFVEAPTAVQNTIIAEPLREVPIRSMNDILLKREIRGIYAGLIMVEAKCIEVDKKQTNVGSEHPPWPALIELHKLLIHEHYDFFSTAYHPAASPATKKLVKKYNMLARLWNHGIQAFLDILQTRLPTSKEAMLSFLYNAYTMLTVLFETIPVLKDKWAGFLGELAGYFAKIANDMEEMQYWHCLSVVWYLRAADGGLPRWMSTQPPLAETPL